MSAEFWAILVLNFPGQKNRFNDGGDPLHWPPDTLYPQKLAPTSPTSGGRSVGIVCLRTKGHGVKFFSFSTFCNRKIFR
jgi:hypothetical protein